MPAFPLPPPPPTSISLLVLRALTSSQAAGFESWLGKLFHFSRPQLLICEMERHTQQIYYYYPYLPSSSPFSLIFLLLLCPLLLHLGRKPLLRLPPFLRANPQPSPLLCAQSWGNRYVKTACGVRKQIHQVLERWGTEKA